ncbi:beta-ketoacyl-[acyl-carrier-protein] synthase family protein [Kribbella sp. CA-293567]|uniref:beta-ketoacyl-[acyl-carrier-protein] synthase family protein n=1 Tax=Kribbella sp. CA-293567 TaxID=3002436 RepID=UPI0022DD148C|nr:beta-ketoacyl-[acyl-carrier-protein] synthase II [Kribbella sp. CA-293567]WBQ02883.1 beta-ketoacyl-[acyl-carrier-protein] synthase II [Kribbella sp. CA-293567]
MSKTRVVITGLGATTPVGGDVASTWEALLAGKSGAKLLTADWVEELPVKIAAPAAVEPTEVIERVKARRLDRNAQFAVVAAREAWADSGLADVELDKTRLGVAIATGIGGLLTTLANYDLLQKGARRVSPLAIPMLMPNSAAANVGLELGALAGVQTPVSACASSNEAISLAADQIRLGRADIVVAGGAEGSITALPLAAFGQMMALSKRNDDPERASRPWDADRDGFLLGEGAGVLVLESYEHAVARGAKIYAEFAGAGITADGHDIVQPDPTGSGAERAMLQALREGDLVAGDIVHINAHATSTPAGDVAEAVAIRKALGKAADNAVATAPKSMVGHLLGAAGAVESIATVLALHHRIVPPTINLDKVDDGVQLDIATEPRKLADGDIAALNNSFGFGGHNVALAFQSF